ncbi:disease resistance-like protein DSC1 [Neltuma alba]|uniref:disease resistance-like protein DSC1 n=1 Tax=Neltuma alba TaxID=207710 RepID=UPI0010A2BF20|nr:disease resistance-like protein DSC1 [Prosopis alba]
MECRNVNKQIVLPVFYDIDPSSVRHQKGPFKKAFARHELKYQGNNLKVQNWRSALKNAAGLSGYVSSHFGNDSELIDIIVKDVSLRLNVIRPSPSESKGLEEKYIPVQEKPLSKRKVFVVLDDVGTLEQLKHLVTEGICWGPGSRVIVTSKYKQALATIGGLLHEMLEVKELDFEESLKLFSLNAFKKSHPERGYEELSKRLVAYAKGLPLVLKVLGLRLCSRDIEAWENTLRKLERHPSPPIRDVLRISYDGLDGGRRQIFLDITYFFERKRKDQVMSLHYANGIFGDCGIKGLLNKGLISVSNDNMIRMPDMIQEMGWEIVCREWNKNTEQRWHWEKLVLQYDQVRSRDPVVLFGTEYRPVVTED